MHQIEFFFIKYADLRCFRSCRGCRCFKFLMLLLNASKWRDMYIGDRTDKLKGATINRSCNLTPNLLLWIFIVEY